PDNLPDDPVVLKQIVRGLHQELVTERATSTIDVVTGLYGRNYMEKEEERVHRAGKYGKLMIDLDGFKEANDIYGHLVGDAVLRHVAQIITSSLQRQT